MTYSSRNKYTPRTYATLTKSINQRLKNHRISSDASKLIFLNYIIFMKRLSKASEIQSKKRQETIALSGVPLDKRYDTFITHEDIEKAAIGVLKEFRG
ncbi:hypothetical protein BJ944DRAFT_272156 [Cunninghamella echinulata]|nr:hypothetical protein BJ944DRAFT_272156 [Cunninghamella echinulata]